MVRFPLLILRWNIKARYKLQDLRDFTIPHEQFSKALGWEILSFVSLFTIAMGLLEYQRFLASVVLFSLASAALSLSVFIQILAVRYWLGKWFLVAVTIIGTVGLMLYLIGIVNQGETTYYASRISLDVLASEQRAKEWNAAHVQKPVVPEPKKPDLIADFVGLTDLLMVISNQGDQTAHQPTFQAVLVDEDKNAGLLPIGKQTGSYLREHASFVRITLLHYGNDSVIDIIKESDRLLGYVILTCDDCKRIRYYWIYYENKKGGWYAESDTEPNSKKFMTEARNPGHLDQLVPAYKRHSIKDTIGIVRYPEQGLFH
jgi:hypothetical protein